MRDYIVSFISNYGFITGGIFMLVISEVILNNGITKKQITNENKIVTVSIIESPKDCDDFGRRDKYCKLGYNGKTFIKRVNKKISLFF